uniref:SFRICE_035377 n=1 Tax=Spodoptera frugiperda TaxID=7108 RepID=A0A2H1V926_SPOFR
MMVSDQRSSDNTLVLAHGRSHQAAANLMATTVATVVAKIRQLGLEVALHKSGAMCFHGREDATPLGGSQITARGIYIGVEMTTKYLGLVLLPEVVRGVRAVHDPLRRPYVGAKPDAAAGSDATHSQRVMAIRVIRGYRTISGETANLLAGLPPWDLKGFEFAAARPHGVMAAITVATEGWARCHCSGVAREAPWVLTYHLTQVPTRHRSFGWFLFLIGREETSECHHCEDSPEDTVEHTVAVCPAEPDPCVRRRVPRAPQRTIRPPQIGPRVAREASRHLHRLTQVLFTGHGSFGFGGGKCPSVGKDHLENTVEHTVAVCPAWTEHRRVLRDVIGDGDLSRPALLQAVVRRRRSAWGNDPPHAPAAAEPLRASGIASRSPATESADFRTASKGSSPPDQNQTRAYGASRSARASKSQTTTDGAQ